MEITTTCNLCDRELFFAAMTAQSSEFCTVTMQDEHVTLLIYSWPLCDLNAVVADRVSLSEGDAAAGGEYAAAMGDDAAAAVATGGDAAAAVAAAAGDAGGGVAAFKDSAASGGCAVVVS
eukprot:m.260753 g.260753  ORF g.260753 m.260753 type:complete len:120 (+) comp19219_c0_seq19:369-728(+)